MSAALHWAAQGLRVFPFSLRRGETLIPPTLASFEPTVIRQWWTPWPEADIAVRLDDLAVTGTEPAAEKALGAWLDTAFPDAFVYGLWQSKIRLARLPPSLPSPPRRKGVLALSSPDFFAVVPPFDQSDPARYLIDFLQPGLAALWDENVSFSLVGGPTGARALTGPASEKAFRK
jgi:hypothetical protein